MENVNLTLPKLKGENIEEHFYKIAKQQIEPYEKLIATIVNSKIPKMPEVSCATFASQE